MNLLTQIRQEMPVFQHRRDDIYKLIITNNELPLQNNKSLYMFADKQIPIETVFYSTQYSYAFTNIRCVVPGRILFLKAIFSIHIIYCVCYCKNFPEY